MSDFFNPQTIDQLERLGGFFQWRRKQLTEIIKADLLRLEAEYQSQLNCKDKLQEEAKSLVFQLQSEKAATQHLAAELQNTNGALKKLQETHDSVLERHDLVTRLLAAKPTINRGLASYKELRYGDYIKFANQESSLASEAEALLMMQAIEKELELLVGFPEIHNKNVIAIGGGFNSGKSEFINSFIKDAEFRLAAGIQPATAIPSYVVAAPSTRIRGNTSNGGCINLAAETYSAISHDFIKSFGFDLKLIMPFMSVGVALDATLFSDICLVDTPGYDPASKDGCTGDRQTVSNFIEQSNALIWVIGLDSNGTFPASDLAFIRELRMAGKDFFVLANKADLRTQGEIENILDEIHEVLFDEGIAYSGISAYSSAKQKEYAFRKKSLFSFLKDQNRRMDIQENLQRRINRVPPVSLNEPNNIGWQK